MAYGKSESYEIDTTAGTIIQTDALSPEEQKYGTTTDEFKQKDEPKKSFFNKVKQKLSEYKKEKSEERLAKAQLNKQYAEQIQQTRRESRLRDYESKLQERQAYEMMSPEEKGLFRKQKMESYGNKLQSVLGGGGLSFEQKVGRITGTGFQKATQVTTGNRSSSNIDRMLGRKETGQHTKIESLAKSSSSFNFSGKVKDFTKGSNYKANVKSELGSMKVKSFLPGSLGLKKDILGSNTFSSKKMKILLGKK